MDSIPLGKDVSMAFSKGSSTYLEVMAMRSSSPESDAGINIRGSHYGTVVQHCLMPVCFSCICSSHFYSIIALLGLQEGEYGKLKVTELTLTREALILYKNRLQKAVY
ncbi:hypothetical protein I79_013428 [Cricetulus griseus]|uniref:Uncharacterized protein n=1 Tax=Cricetulus griseus TaxID=10029 RepID=G3HRG1_CRIGR|nr:hypothetical protein I79_013428 [Cricetulus griseus]